VTHLTPHFTLEELTMSQTAERKGISNKPTATVLTNLQRTAETLEKVRVILGEKPIHISSGYRSPKLNTAIGGAKNSAHQYGLAIDFSCTDFGTPLAICKKLEPHMKALEIDQLIHEYKTWVHLGLRNDEPRHQKLTINDKGTQTGFV
jgi:zinc D-Ala-D-Ala carboxypeptidase